MANNKYDLLVKIEYTTTSKSNYYLSIYTNKTMNPQDDLTASTTASTVSTTTVPTTASTTASTFTVVDHIQRKIAMYQAKIRTLEYNLAFESSDFAKEYEQLKLEYNEFYNTALRPFIAEYMKGKAVARANQSKQQMVLIEEMYDIMKQNKDVEYKIRTMRGDIIHNISHMLRCVHNYILGHKSSMILYMQTLNEDMDTTLNTFVNTNLKVLPINTQDFDAEVAYIKSNYTKLYAVIDHYVAVNARERFIKTIGSDMSDPYEKLINTHKEYVVTLANINAQIHDIERTNEQNVDTELIEATKAHFQQVNPELYTRYVDVVDRWASNGVLHECCGQRTKLDDDLLFRPFKDHICPTESQ